MRQAGRSLPEYLQLRKGIGMLESCMNPELVTEITLQPVRRYGVDAAIFFSDIVLPLKAVGVDLDIIPGVGPVVASPLRALADRPDPGSSPGTSRSSRPRSGPGPRARPTPLIGFAGAPFTLASYLVEGGPSKAHARTKAMMLGDPTSGLELMRQDRRRISRERTFEIQVAAGA